MNNIFSRARRFWGEKKGKVRCEQHAKFDTNEGATVATTAAKEIEKKCFRLPRIE